MVSAELPDCGPAGGKPGKTGSAGKPCTPFGYMDGPAAPETRVALLPHPEGTWKEAGGVHIKKCFVLRRVVEEFIAVPAGANMGKFEADAKPRPAAWTACRPGSGKMECWKMERDEFPGICAAKGMVLK